MLVLSKTLTIGQITFILRVVIQILAYGGLFLLGLLVLASAPRVATLETHDVINRVVGKSTATTSSMKWIFGRIASRKDRDLAPSPLLLWALALSLIYGLLVSLTDIGFIGLNACEVAGTTRLDFPASVRSDEDARQALEVNLIPGVDPTNIRRHMCDSAEPKILDGDNSTILVCTSWRNTTYGDPTQFQSLNSTDSDTLMPLTLGYYNHTRAAQFDLSRYLVGATSEGQKTPVIQNGIAVIPHDTGVRMIAGVPKVGLKEKVHLPQTLALEVEMACMPTGTMGQEDVGSVNGPSANFFVPDDLYQANWTGRYSGPENLRDPLLSSVARVRELMKPLYNSSDLNPSGFWMSINETRAPYTWPSTITGFFPTVNGSAGTTETRYILGNCSAEVHSALGVSTPPEGASTRQAQACGLYQMLGSTFQGRTTFQQHYEMMCATSTSFDMVSTTLAVDGEGRVSNPELIHLPSDFYSGYASYFDITPRGEDMVYNTFEPLVRFALSSNPSGPTRHYIHQWDSIGTTARSLTQGAGNPGFLLTLVGSAMVGVNSLDLSTIAMINSTFFSADYRPEIVTRWGGSVGASYILSTIGYNPWVARGSQAFEVQSTGGKAAVCYEVPYAAAFLPLVLAALIVVFLTMALFLRSKLKGTKRWENLYGGLAPAIVSPVAMKPGKGEVLAWQEGDEPHLRPVYSSMPLPNIGMESQTLMTPHYKSEYM
ncbi:unnamed protein product [Cyclocybe aegerita]|uniref:Uncharacterized protein n=1 Tax=Cyclocybe aegerita TaxID=1973307 RepID=A0A8S0VU81_CYCAE|nr:unnamed protein product [Cyclocybe aegerita]